MPKVFCGNAQIRETKIGQVVSIDLNINDLRAILEEVKAGTSEAQVREYTDKGGVVQMVLKLEALPSKNPPRYSTHSLKINTYVKPAAATAAATAATAQPLTPEIVDKRNEYIHDATSADGLPF